MRTILNRSWVELRLPEAHGDVRLFFFFKETAKHEDELISVPVALILSSQAGRCMLV